MKYIAILKQEAEGCDYTINCGTQVISLKSTDSDGARDELINLIYDEYIGETSLEDATILEVYSEVFLDLPNIYSSWQNHKEQQKLSEKELLEKAEYERLKKKYEQ